MRGGESNIGKSQVAGPAWCRPSTFDLRLLTPLFLLGAFAPAIGETSESDAMHYWPQWRGPLATGVAPHADPPVEWGEDKNIRWIVPLEGVGHSTPVVWGDLVILTLAVPIGDPVDPVPPHEHAHGAHDNLQSNRHHTFDVLAVRRMDGSIAWQRTVRKALPHEGGHVTGSLASHSPATDGERVYAFFGSRGLHCLDMEGEPQWSVDLGEMHTRHAHGEGSSPVLYGNTLVVNWDHEGDSFVAAFDTEDGKERWRVKRDEMTSWSSPIVVQAGGKPQVVISATGRVRGYDLATGEGIWHCGGLSRNVVASPVAGDGLVFAGNSYDWQAMLAIRLEGARGDLDGTEHIAWKLDRFTPYVPSPLYAGGRLYFLRHNQDLLSCVDGKTGKPVYGPLRLQGIDNVFASPVAAAERLYITDRDGTTVVLRLGDEPEVLATNTLDESFSASPALVSDEIYLRGREKLYCITRE